jgi:chromosome partitioning protein
MDLDLSHAGEAKKATGTLSRLLGELADDYDVVFLDTPPSLSLVSENVLRAAHVLCRSSPPCRPGAPSTSSSSSWPPLDGHRPAVHGFFSLADARKTPNGRTSAGSRSPRCR